MENFLDKVGNFIIKGRKFILPVFIVIALVCAYLQTQVAINDDMTKYLPEDSETTIATEIMYDEFGKFETFKVMIVGIEESEIETLQNRILNINDGDSVQRVSIENQTEADTDGKLDVLYSVSLKEGLSFHDAKEVVADVKEDLTNYTVAMSGHVVNEQYIDSMAGDEAKALLLVIIPALLLILLITSKSFFEPVIVLITIVFTIMIAQGTNVIFEDVSYITNNMFAVLMIAISMDYSVFMLHTFKDARDEGLPTTQAAVHAFKKSFTTISAASLTTMAGFISFTLMEFTFGADIGWVFAKGILVALITSALLVPCLLVFFDKLIIKTSHRDFLPSFKLMGKGVLKIRYVVMPVVLALIIAGTVLSNQNDFVYGNSAMIETPGTILYDDNKVITDTFGKHNQLVLLMPKTSTLTEEKAIIDQITAIEHVDSEVLALSTIVEANAPALMGADLDTVYTAIGTEVTDEFHGDEYIRIIFNLDTPEESEEAFDTILAIREVLPEDGHLLGGTSAALDMKESISSDYYLVLIVSLVAVGLIIGLSFKSIILPIFLLLAVQGGVFINMTIPYVTGQAIPYVAYILIGTIQLGATIDYAILFTRKYMDNRKNMSKKQASYTTTNQVAGSILTSGGVLMAAGFAMYLTSNDAVVSKIGFLLGFGASISVVSVFVFLPALLTIFDRAIEKTTYDADFFD